MHSSTCLLVNIPSRRHAFSVKCRGGRLSCHGCPGEVHASAVAMQRPDGWVSGSGIVSGQCARPVKRRRKAWKWKWNGQIAEHGPRCRISKGRYRVQLFTTKHCPQLACPANAAASHVGSVPDHVRTPAAPVELVDEIGIGKREGIDGLTGLCSAFD